MPYRNWAPLCSCRGYKKCEGGPETTILMINPFCWSTYLLMWVVLCHSKICCFCPSWWPLLLIRGGPKKQQSIPTTHFVGKHHIYMQKGHPFRINILCFKKQQSVPKTHFIDKYYIYSHKGHLSRINILCRLHRMLILSTTSSLTCYYVAPQN